MSGGCPLRSEHLYRAWQAYSRMLPVDALRRRKMNGDLRVAYSRDRRQIVRAGRAVVPLAAAVALSLSGGLSAATITVNSATALSVPASCTIVDAVASINQGSLVVTSNCANSGA